MSADTVQRVVAIDWSGRVDTSGQRRHIYAATWTSVDALPPRAAARVRARAATGKQAQAGAGDQAPAASGKQAQAGAGKQTPAGAGDQAHTGKGDQAPAGAGDQAPAAIGEVRLTNGRTRDEVVSWLIGLAAETPRMVVGFDFCFSFPEWFVRDELGCADGPAFWEFVAHEHGERWLTRSHEDPRFWGKPRKRPPEFSGADLHRMMRATDIDCKLIAHIPEDERVARVRGITPKSVFQIGGSGSVGTASLRGMPNLLALRSAGFRVWPFDPPALDSPALDPPALDSPALDLPALDLTALDPPALAAVPEAPAPAAPGPLVVEMYSRLNTGPVHKSNPAARAAYLRARQAADPAYANLPRAALTQALASEDAFDALVSCMVMTARRAEFPNLPAPRDPKFRTEGWTWAPGV